jgi:hypothetical protein
VTSFLVLKDKASVHTFVDESADLKRLKGEVARRLDGDPGHDMAHFVRVAVWTSRIGCGPFGVAWGFGDFSNDLNRYQNGYTVFSFSRPVGHQS